MLRDLVERVAIPRLSAYGMTGDDVHRVGAASRGGSMKTNPLPLEDAELTTLVERRL